MIPLVRSRQPPENAARSVAVGLLWAFTPTFGVQMAFVCVHWYVARVFFRRDFNVVVAMAWTWITNVFTVAPTYYAFFVAGQILLGRWGDLSGYRGFQEFRRTALGEIAGDPASFEAWRTYVSVVAEGWGLAMLVGSAPFAALAYVAGYRWALRVTLRWRARRRRARRVRAEGAVRS